MARVEFNEKCESGIREIKELTAIKKFKKMRKLTC